MIVMWDTSALISLVDKNRANHETAKNCYRKLLEHDELQIVSSIAISEYAVQADASLLLQNLEFCIQEFNLNHALTAANLKKTTLGEKDLRSLENTRNVVVNDTQLIGQAHAENVEVILTEDASTFCKTVAKLRDKGVITLKAILLNDNPLQYFGYTHTQGELDL